MDNYEDYYVEQSGSGLTAFEGNQYQRGHGFFGTLFNSIIKPLGKYLGKQALSTGVRMGSDFLSGENIKDSFKKNIRITGDKILDDSYKKAKKYTQSGSGRKRKAKKANKRKTKPKKRSVASLRAKRTRATNKTKKRKKRSRRKLSKKDLFKKFELF